MADIPANRARTVLDGIANHAVVNDIAPVLKGGKVGAFGGAGVGKTKRVTAQGVADARNDIMLYAIVEAESHDAAARAFEGHPHFGIPQASIDLMPLSSLPDPQAK